MKKYLPFVVVGLLVILLSGYLVIRSRQKQNNINTQTPEVEVAQALINQRPFVTLTPDSQAHQITLKAINLQNIKTVEYELVYLVGDQQRGVIGSIETNGNSAIQKDMLLGSCSKNVCKYDEGVTEGSLTLRFRGNGSVSKYETAFHLQKMPTAKNELNVDNKNFVFTGTLPKNVMFLTMNTVGVPKDPGKEIVSGPYGIFSSDNGIPKGIAKITYSGSDTVNLLGWNPNQSSWQEVGKSATEGLNVFILVK
ncbi:hypothetical protein COT44_04670 [Candidatus Shapirobacteria bacterium CG08_land_8_20_14_0_20_39_18]|uniref:Uncharacterized protein n=1 Tax=Candidatus Shapirobacteria bacterium CG08_land_8_20_14_0_20_39_18 TaxID=1974883 RepID=A0A2M6XBZ4_9BACT|nr:MAG: hypothetical protein COT44_04670 [Candidatus Shapirobacteria bacterium CG08_land_8_20_14_0_20_39_18]PIY65348.1 MAG: hypothetical protein COY91_02960 [Candidatus Shapirobacteria bacterium CG_4_10_14_0_8_um_filter_39_15]PJE68199.1 MAG: hypothetical protein COU94_03135 [Candidatus Shapirobacteria bacterium CG10_big_fil_rev_8_21_14_0_10_38_8]